MSKQNYRKPIENDILKHSVHNVFIYLTLFNLSPVRLHLYVKEENLKALENMLKES